MTFFVYNNILIVSSCECQCKYAIEGLITKTSG